MPKRTNSLNVSGSNETIIGTGVSAKGTLISETDITIDGTFAGDIKSGGNVVLGLNAIVKADIRADNVVVAGNLDGNIKAQGETSIAESGRVNGDITTALLAIASGAVFIGASKMSEPSPPPQPTPPDDTEA